MFDSFASAAHLLHAWEHRYNHDRLSITPQGLMPAEKLATVLPPRNSSSLNRPCTHSMAAA